MYYRFKVKTVKYEILNLKTQYFVKFQSEKSVNINIIICTVDKIINNLWSLFPLMMEAATEQRAKYKHHIKSKTCETHR